MSFDDLQKLVKELESEFNSKIVSMLNNCDEPVIILFPPSYTAYKSKEDAMNNPLLVKIRKEVQIPTTHREYVYSSLSK